MAKPPDKPKKPRDYARPTRAKAARPEAPPTDPALERLLNPGIERGTAGMGSGTGLQPPPARSFQSASESGIQKQARSERLDSGSAPSARPGTTDGTGLQPPPDNSFDRRADFSAAHRARKSTQDASAKGFAERPQSGYAARGEVVDINAELRKALGYDGDSSKTLIGRDEAEEEAASSAPPSPGGEGRAPQARG